MNMIRHNYKFIQLNRCANLPRLLPLPLNNLAQFVQHNFAIYNRPKQILPPLRADRHKISPRPPVIIPLQPQRVLSCVSRIRHFKWTSTSNVGADGNPPASDKIKNALRFDSIANQKITQQMSIPTVGIDEIPPAYVNPNHIALPSDVGADGIRPRKSPT